MSQLTLCLHHELTLLLLDDVKGNFNGTMCEYGLAGAVLSELILQGLITVSSDDDQIVSVVDATPLGEPVLDETLKLLSESSKPASLSHWIYPVAQLPDFCPRVARQLCELGILEYNESKVLWVFTQKRFPEVDGSYENTIRGKMAEIMFDPDAKSDERTAVLIALAKSTNALTANFAPVQLNKHQARIKEICDGKQLASGAALKAIESVQACMAAIQAASTSAATMAAISAINN